MTQLDIERDGLGALSNESAHGGSVQQEGH